jgi:sulfite reductase (NADPH) hemoprotein beta-component
VTLGGSDGSAASGAAQAGKVIGPSFSAEEVTQAVQAVLQTYVALRMSAGSRREMFIDTVRRVGIEPFKAAANRVRTVAEEVV